MSLAVPPTHMEFIYLLFILKSICLVPIFYNIGNNAITMHCNRGMAINMIYLFIYLFIYGVRYTTKSPFRGVRYNAKPSFRGASYTAEPTFCSMWIFGKKWKRPRVSLRGPGGALWWKTNTKKSRDTVPKVENSPVFVKPVSGNTFPSGGITPQCMDHWRVTTPIIPMRHWAATPWWCLHLGVSFISKKYLQIILKKSKTSY